MGAIYTLSVVIGVAGMLWCWNSDPSEFESVEQHRRQMDAIAPEEQS